MYSETIYSVCQFKTREGVVNWYLILFWRTINLGEYVYSTFIVELEQLPVFCLTFCSLRDNMISAEGVCALVRVFQVNQSLQKLELTGWGQPYIVCKKYIYAETIMSLPILCLNIRKHCMDGCVQSWLMITALIRAPHLWQTTECAYKYCHYSNRTVDPI